jgi:hypothetical protein
VGLRFLGRDKGTHLLDGSEDPVALDPIAHLTRRDEVSTVIVLIEAVRDEMVPLDSELDQPRPVENGMPETMVAVEATVSLAFKTRFAISR